MTYSAKDDDYWQHLHKLDEKYGFPVKQIALRAKYANDATKYQQALLIYSLLKSNPETHTIPQSEELLQAAKIQIEVW
eukprot:CAMPEP_0117039400 /NCGR_PEP_ID=MMETSP0472-20121206/27657_1 /TAXON_ID=693140 ORGANISM="Tiarina fusus, Strain LIS" /NCGR_SAMPLE_ID=MMETSP0472 /ASSEMBLY_ACC=CAM_ASM_000603 /LENGTH=77 /DNA_ID=CAMNT_0004749885 /DNA_START=45 /DNA_END=275 /DNA_ORIENTATION=-